MRQLRRFWYAFAIGFMLLGILLGGWLVGIFPHAPQSESLSGTTPQVASPTPTIPPYRLKTGAHLVIPAIQVDAPIEYVGKSASGDMGVPTQNPWTGVGWYHDGTAPGSRGSAVIDGHLDRPGGSPAVFWRLRDLHIGDTITFINGQDTLHFRVTALNYYKPNEAPLSQIFMNRAGTFLNLITCAGIWVPSEHQTTLRLVVYTTLVA